jgi:hypothetical protein
MQNYAGATGMKPSFVFLNHMALELNFPVGAAEDLNLNQN